MQATVWRITAADSSRDQRRAARALAAAGLRAGDRLALAVPPSPASLAVIVGALRTGIVPVLLNATLTAAEIGVLLADADPALAIADEGHLAGLMEAGERGKTPDLAPVPRARPMLYTSGTTGRPKGVWSGVLADADATAQFDDEADHWGFRPGDVTLICSPLYHSAPIRFATSTLLRGGDVVLLSHFEAARAGEAIETHRPTAAFMVPAHLQRLFSLPQRPDLGSFRLLAHAGAPCPVLLKRAAFDAFPPGSVWEFYGATEGQFTACGPDEWLARPGTVGRARAGRRVEVDPDGQIWCHAPAHARFEYWRDPAKTAAAWRGDAFSVGDMGRIDADGYLYLDGRRDDLIISGGVNVYPAEVEQALSAVPGVLEVAVFGRMDDRWGERVCAAYTGPAEPAALAQAAETALAPYKRPKEIHRVEDLPRTPTGKIRRLGVAAALGLDQPAG